MPRSNNISVQNNFIKGLITEATALTFPENACVDTDNCIFNHYGVVERRLGFEFEDSFTAASIDPTASVIVTYLWENVAGEGDITFVVVQVGNTLHFYEVAGDTALSDNKHATTINLLDHDSGVASVANLECQFSSGNGLLFVTGERINTFYVEYNSGAGTLTANTITIEIRDFEGDSADTETVTSRPTATLAGLDANHRYNLENQGWTSAQLTSWDSGNTTMPSNADVNWYFKNSTDDFDFASTRVDDFAIGNSPAPKGHFIYSIYNVNRSANVTGATDFAISLERVRTSAFFAGRVFYAGLQIADHTSRIYFSQIIEQKDTAQYGKCYQVNDPTSEMLFDLLPTDGGVIDIIEAGAILKMFPVLNALIVFATNGVWAITGSQGIGFTANDYSVNKISSITNVSHTSFVDVEGVPYWWNLEGIYTIKIDPQSNAFRVESITDGTIRNFFLDIPSESKQFARGVYDQFERRIQWIYKSGTSLGINDKYIYDRILNYNLLSQAFFPWSVDVSDVKINSIVNVFGYGGSFEEFTVVNGADTIINGADTVVAFVANSGLTSRTKYFVTYTSSGAKATFAETHDEDYKDWTSFDSAGVSYSSYLSSGYALRGQALRKFQSNYINVFSDNDEETTFKIRGQWNFANSANSGRWSAAQTFTVTAEDFDYKPNKIKIRGHGLACQFRIENNGDEPFKIVGWSVFETGNNWI